MCNRLQIMNIELLKIKRVKDWCINFDYAGEKYLLHESTEIGEPDVITLYKREKVNDCGCYKSVVIKASSRCHDLDWYLGGWRRHERYMSGGKIHKGNNSYKTIDLLEFVKRLTFDGFIDSNAIEWCSMKKAMNESRNVRIKELEEQIRNLRSEIYDMSII